MFRTPKLFGIEYPSSRGRIVFPKVSDHRWLVTPGEEEENVFGIPDRRNPTLHSPRLSLNIQAAFTTGEPFWMKGSTLVGVEFHETAMVHGMWHIIGHLNGNAICESICQTLNHLRCISKWKRLNSARRTECQCTQGSSLCQKNRFQLFRLTMDTMTR